MNKKTLFYILYVVSIFGVCCFVAGNIAYNAAPDEFARIPLAEYFMNNLSLPDARDPSIKISGWGYSYGSQPYIPQIISGVLMHLAWDNPSSIFFARLTSALFMCGFAIFCILIAEKVFKKTCYKWMFIVFTTALPQILYIGSYVNNECMALLSSAMIVYGWIIALDSKWSWKSCIFLGISMSVCILSYYTAYGFCLATAIIYCINCYQQKVPIKTFLIKGLLMVFIVFVLAGWFFIRNAILYDGDFFGLKIREIEGELYADPGLKPSDRAGNLGGSEYVKDRSYALLVWLPWTVMSFIGCFGYMTVKLPLIVYILYCLVFGAGIVGFFITKKRMSLFKWIMIISIIIPFILSFVYSFTQDFQPQGRYVITIAVPLFYFIVKGYEGINRKKLTWFLTILYFCSSLVILFTISTIL